MSLMNTTTTYGSVSKFFHWLIFLLVLFMIVYGYFLEDFPKEYQPLVYSIHKLTGLAILALMVLRLLWALINPKPVLPADMKWWERMATNIVHFLLYVTVIAMPLTGWIGSVAGGRPPRLGTFSFDLPIAQSKSLAGFNFETHETLAICIIVLVIIHALAALYHHYIKKDDVLRRMLPRCRQM